MIYSYNGILDSNEKEWQNGTQHSWILVKNMDTKRYILYNCMYMKFKTYGDSSQNSGPQCVTKLVRVRPLGVRGGHLPVCVVVRNALGRVGSKPLPFSVVSLGTMRWTYVFNKCLLNSSMQE